MNCPIECPIGRSATTAANQHLPIRKSPKALSRSQLIERGIDPDLSGLGEGSDAGHPSLPSLPVDGAADVPALPTGNPYLGDPGDETDPVAAPAAPANRGNAAHEGEDLD